MNNKNNKKLLMPKTPLGIATVLFFCLIWWLLNTYPCLHFFNDMVKGGKIVWALGMPINFTYVILVALIAIIWTIVILLKWEASDEL